MGHPSVIEILRSGQDTTAWPKFSEDERNRYKQWATPLTRAAIGLASWLPEVDPAAIIEFVEFPKIRLAVSKFEGEYWSKVSEFDRSHRFISSITFRKAAASFQYSPVVDRPDFKLSSLRPQLPYHHIVTFMREVFTWTVVERTDLAIRPYLLPGNKNQLPILVGTLAAYLFVSDNDSMPGTPIEDMSGLSSKKETLPVYPEWKARHDPNDPEASRRLLYLSYENADWYRVLQEYSEAGWLETLMQQLQPEFLRTQERVEEVEPDR
ncbi:hypothetical protein F4813DRAFT_388543 [Daldinia decipiens]|uniref:uncharacterized protein n=1 Tax=Daldinia decipiens TaxID=326647 RepID=UPI0020C347DE|nr:uncharacterized protein F4813DRAFT_388543 [Daldinia decipiens]KAI1658777.1 hypothetical protein F4813DRAFT_388543 [Daldinia decipiens]